MKKIYFKQYDKSSAENTGSVLELPEMNDWDFVSCFYPDYYSCHMIALHDDLQCYFDKEKTREEIEHYNEDLKRLDEVELKHYFNQLTEQIQADAAVNFYLLLRKEEIEIIYKQSVE